MKTNPDPLRRAFRLACLGAGRASPNPLVGAVVVRDGRIVGQGTHTYAGRHHAERIALDQAGEAARGADLYVTLEPCGHQGRTPPCAEAVAAAGIRRVVCGMVDPNPLVSGRGIEYLRQRGITVELAADPGPFERLNRAFAKHITRRLPWVVLKAALSLDGRIAPAAGPARWITGEAARAAAHGLRYRCDAILAGIGTVLADDPALTCRYKRPRPAPLRLIVLDAALRIPLESQLVRTAGEQPLEIFCAASADAGRRRPLEALGVKVTPLPEGAVPEGRLPLDLVLERLAAEQVTSVLVEGGRDVLTAFVRQGLADEACFFLAPKLYGDGGLPLLGDLGATTADGCPRLEVAGVRRLGPDLLVHAFFPPAK